MGEMVRAKKMCATCPFRGMSAADRYENAVVPPDDWPCHTEHPIGWGETQCRGHYEARRKFPPAPHEVVRLKNWQRDLSALMAANVPIDALPPAPMRDPMLDSKGGGT